MVFDDLRGLTKNGESVITEIGPDFSGFCNTIFDMNPLHRDRGYAQRKGFGDVIAPGVLLEAHAEQQVRELLDVVGISDPGIERHYVSHSFKFKNPVYPGDKLSYRFNLDCNDKSTLNLMNSRGEVVANSRFQLSLNKLINETDWTDGGYDSDSLTAGRYDIDAERVEAFCKHLGITSGEDVPNLFVASLIPATLLSYVENMTGTQEGVYRGVDLNFFERPELGRFVVAIYQNRKPRTLPNGRGFVYDLTGVCETCDEDDNPTGKVILSGDMKVTSEHNLIPEFF